MPTPLFDLLPGSFFIRRVIQATRGCPFTCSFCTVPTINPGNRTRPIEDVIKDIKYDRFPHWWQRRVVWFWDDNLTAKRFYIRELLIAMIPLRKWWLTQASMDIGNDDALLDLMEESGCIGIFFGMEWNRVVRRRVSARPTQASKQNQHRSRNLCNGGFIAGFDSDTPESTAAMAEQLYQAGVDVPLLSVLTPYPGTPAYSRLVEERRILSG